MNELTIYQKPLNTGEPNLRLSFTSRLYPLMIQYILPYIAHELKMGSQTTDKTGRHTWLCRVTDEKALKIARIFELALEKCGPYASQNNIIPHHHLLIQSYGN